MQQDVKGHWEIRTSNRRRPLAAWRAMRELMRDGEQTGEVFKIIEALKGASLTKAVARMRGTEGGRRLLAQKPDILARLEDREALRQLPEDSLGKTYLRFVEAENLSADGLTDAAMEAPKQGARDADEIWFAERIRDTHDLYHVVSGYGRDGLGEVSLLEFGNTQTPNLGISYIVYMSNRSSRKEGHAEVVMPCMTEAKDRASRARWLADADWENLLEKPLTQVREELGLSKPATYLKTRLAWPDEKHPPTDYEVAAA